MRQTQTAVDVARELLANLGTPQWGTGLRDALRLAPGTLYPILDRMRVAGWLSAQWEDPEQARREHTGPPRRYYTVTTLGKTELATYVRRWDDTRSR